MKAFSRGLALALPLVAGCGQAFNQSTLPSGAQSSIPAVRAHPDSCAIHDNGTHATGGFLKMTSCGGSVARLFYGSGSAGNLKITTQGFTTNPGGVPVPTGETPVLFIQMVVLPQDPGPATFTAPTVPPNSNRSRITNIPTGNTYKFYAYSGITLLTGFPINLGSPNSGGTLFFTASPWSPLPLLPSLPPGSTINFELTKP